MSDDPSPDPLDAMAAHSLLASDAPRFLVSLFTLGPGDHRIVVDHPEVEAPGAWLHVSEARGARRAHLSFPSTFGAENDAGVAMPAVWHHWLVEAGVLREAKTLEETLPELFDVEVPVQALAAGGGSVEDLCDACGLARDAGVRGTAPPAPLESEAAFGESSGPPRP